VPLLVSLRDNPDFAFHGDLFFEIEGLRLQADTYYFELDRPVHGPTGMEAVRRSLAMLLDQWIQRVAAQADGETAYLPFDYSDQCTGVVVVHREEDVFALWSGWSNREGWAHYPSDISEFTAQIGPVQETRVPCVRMPRLDFIAELRRSRAAIAHGVRTDRPNPARSPR
jgi:hypothetical protein